MKELFKSQNGHQVVGVANSEDVKNISEMDSKLLHNMDFSENTKSLGLLNLFENSQIVKVPFLRDIKQNSDYIYTNGKEQSVRWKIPMDLDYPTVVQNIEDEGQEQLGIDSIPFNIKLSHQFRQGDILTYDLYDGVQVQVIEDSEIVNEGDGFVHTVIVSERDRNAYFPASKLKPGTQFFKVGSVQGEYSTNAWSGLTGYGTPKFVELEHRLGSPQGVEVSWTDFANAINIDGEENGHITEHLLSRSKALGEPGYDETGNYLFVGQKKKNGKYKVNKVQNLLEALAMAELYKMKATRLMFAHQTTVTGINGSKQVSSGIYPQLRRGHRFTYRNENELEAMIRQAADVIYSNVPVPVEYREMKFKAGHRAHTLVRQMFKDRFTQTYPLLLDQNAVGGHQLLEGSDRHNMTYKSFAIGKAFLDGIGYVEIEHDPSLDYDFGDIISRGYTGGMSKRSYSMVIWDVTDPTYTNVYDKDLLPEGVTVDQRASGKNLYLIKPENQPEVAFGKEVGRVSGQNVISSMRYAGETFWARCQLDALIPDLRRTILIEKEDAFTEDGIQYFDQ